MTDLFIELMTRRYVNICEELVVVVVVAVGVVGVVVVVVCCCCFLQHQREYHNGPKMPKGRVKYDGKK